MEATAIGEKVLVTGATGLLGSHLAEQLTRQGASVRALVRPRSATGFLDTLGVEIVRGDLTDAGACREPWPGSHASFTARRRLATGDPGVSFKPAASTRPARSPRRPGARASTVSFT